ncbi:MAG: hypothetical protein MT334_02085 [Candidatus Nitrosopumilus limneticus]|nr:hypothetical protein [Candidatus Nitrosopumilus limneticus]
MNLTFLIPVKIESPDRVRNLSTILCYLLSKFDAIVSIKECDYETKFESNIFPILIEKFGSVPKNLTYVFEKQKSKFFHKTKLLNDLLEKSNSEIVCNYDTDVLLPESSILNAYKMISSGQSDAVYPYGCGVYQKAVTYSQEIFNNFLNSNLDVSFLDKHATINNSTIGWCQFVRRENYINSFMMNENFYAWGPEDCEFHYRLNFLGNKVDRIDNYVYHLEHTRSNDSWFSNPMWRENTELWYWIRNQSKESFLNYYKNQNYINRRN